MEKEQVFIMKYFSILFLTGVMITIPFCNFGNENQSKKEIPEKMAVYLDSVEIYHTHKAVYLPVEGILEPWKQIKLFLPDSARLISVLVEPGSEVKKGDLLASLWRLNRRGENTPIDLIAPINGRIETVNFRLNQYVPAYKPVISIVNSDHLTFWVSIKPAYAGRIKKRMPVELNVNGKHHSAGVNTIDYKQLKVEISLYNKDGSLPVHSFARGRIVCGVHAGDFLDRKYFLNKDSLKIQLKDNIQLTLFPAGQADSLIQIYPALPGQDFIRIYQKNLDL